jgi:pSer/pThr/pTyr-binding forkhead associated (FHA) protein
MARMAARLECLRGLGKGKTFPLSPVDTLIGRSCVCDVQLPDAGVSRRHARITRQGDAFVVDDLASRHGTSVGDVAVNATRLLLPGDVLRVGPVFLRLHLVPVTESDPPGGGPPPTGTPPASSGAPPAELPVHVPA